MGPEIQITAEGLAGVHRDLDELVKVRRPDIVGKIKAAREHGDLSENFEYHAAKNEQGFIESRIAELEAIIKNAVVVERQPPNGTVQLLSTVRFVEGEGAEEEYRIVGPAEADATARRISDASEMGKALMGRKLGDEVEIQTPNGGSYSVRITSVD